MAVWEGGGVNQKVTVVTVPELEASVYHGDPGTTAIVEKTSDGGGTSLAGLAQPPNADNAPAVL